MKQRLIWVDYAKAIGILLVVYGHVARGIYNAGLPIDVTLFTLADDIVYSFHVPLFFFLSGLVFYDSLQRKSHMALIINKLQTIAYPYLIWSIIQGSIVLMLANYTNSTKSLTDLLSILWKPTDQFWFLYILFWFNLICIFVYSHLKAKYFVLVVLICTLINIIPIKFIPFLKDNPIVHHSVFFVFGIWFNRYKQQIQTIAQTKLVLFLGLSFIFAQNFVAFYYQPNHYTEQCVNLALSLLSIT